MNSSVVKYQLLVIITLRLLETIPLATGEENTTLGKPYKVPNPCRRGVGPIRIINTI